MSKKIVILNGSPREEGNTKGLINAFTEGAMSAGHSVKSFSLDSMDINGCKGCYEGGKDPKSPCKQKDDMDKIYQDFIPADIVVLASPQYFGTISGQLLTTLDRLYAVIEADIDEKSIKKDCYLMMAAEGEDFDSAINQYNALIDSFEWKNLGSILAGGVNLIGDIDGHDEIDLARELGKTIK